MTDVIDITATRAVFNGGKFDTDFRFLRTTATGVMTTLLAGPSIAVNFNPSSNISYRYKCGTYVIVAASPGVSAPSNVSNTPTGIAL